MELACGDPMCVVLRTDFICPLRTDPARTEELHGTTDGFYCSHINPHKVCFALASYFLAFGE